MLGNGYVDIYEYFTYEILAEYTTARRSRKKC